MSRLYEIFILGYFNHEHKELEVRACQITWGIDDGEDTMLSVMQTDITLRDYDRTRDHLS